MTPNFDNNEISKVLSTIKNKLLMCINRAGNITIMIPGDKSQKWTLKIVEGKYVWQRFSFVTGYGYPLNMINRKNLHREKSSYSRRMLEWYRAFDNCSFDTIDGALEYFVKYMNKYKNIKL